MPFNQGNMRSIASTEPTDLRVDYLKELEMNMRVLIVVTIVSAAVSLPAFAGRDAGQTMQQEKANTAAAQERTQHQAGCDTAAERLALPLDHGPRADTTPWLNQQRRLRAIEKCQAALGTSPK